MANNKTTTLPARLTLTENGYHEPLPYWKNPEVDDEEWISYGWKAITYEGHVHYSHKEKANVQQWLAEHGYIDTGDGSHFLRSGRLSQMKTALDAGKRIEVQDGSGATIFQKDGKYYMDYQGVTGGTNWQDFINRTDFEDDTWIVIL